MICPRAALLSLAALCIPAFGQSLVSTHSGIVYFFDPSVWIEGQRLEQKFGRFPDIGESRELRTEDGRAEVLLTPGVFLRIGEHSAIRMLSSKFSNTRVELLVGSAILEANEPAADTAVRMIHKNWQVRLPEEGVYRIDSEPPRVAVYKGEVEVSIESAPDAITTIRQGQMLPLASLLIPEPTAVAGTDEFKSWAMSRSQAISSDNATAAGITDDPGVIENSADALAGLSYFPLTGIPGVAVTNPYGLSFWSPFQSMLSSIYFPSYSYGSLYPAGWPTIIRHHLWVPPRALTHPPSGGGLRSGGTNPPRAPYTPPFRTPHPVATPHAGPRPGVRR